MSYPTDTYISIRAGTPTPRLVYALDITLGTLLGLQWVFSDNPDPAAIPLAYGVPARPGEFALYDCGLLREQGIRPDPPAVDTEGAFPRLFPAPPGFGVSYDVLAAVFYLVTEYELYTTYHSDTHDRYDLSAYPSVAWGLDDQPLAHRWAAELWTALTAHTGPQKRPLRAPRSAAGCVTIDVDFPWKYLHKGIFSMAGLAADLARGQFVQLWERLRALITGIDPNDTFNLLTTVCPPDKTLFFFLIERHSPHDSRFTWRHRPYRALIRSLRDQGYRLGIHPSYTTFLAPAKIAAERQALGEMTCLAVRDSRQHFLRYRLPDTLHHLLAAGIRADFTPCRVQSGGFPAGMAVPYYWFDLLADTPSPLLRWPAMIMDRTLQQYMQLSPAEALARMQTLLATTCEVGGVFTLLLHNDSLSESGEWQGWRPAIREMIRLTTALPAPTFI